MNINDVWFDRFKTTLGKIGNIESWLLILNLTVILTFVKQYVEFRNQQKELKQIEVMLNKPWDKLKWLYEGTNGYLEHYTEDHATKWTQLCLASLIEVIRVNNNLGKDKNKPATLTSIKEISYAGRVLSYYNSDLFKVVSSQKNAITFNSLDKETLGSLISIFTFDKKAEADSFKNGIEKARMTGLLHLQLDSVAEASGKSVMRQRFRNVLAFARNTEDFITITNDMLLRDTRSFGDSRITDEQLALLRGSIDSFASGTGNLGQYKERQKKCLEAIESFKTGNFFELPLVKIEISVVQFIIFASLVNICIIIYLRQLWDNLEKEWDKVITLSNTPPLTLQDKIDLWYGWHNKMDKKTPFVVLYSSLLSLMAFTALAFGLVLFNHSFFAILMLFILCSGILIFAVNSSFRFYTIIQAGKSKIRVSGDTDTKTVSPS